ncbi:VOC family protein [Chondromyces apiculatus]|uniref:Glyoxalase family protein n=1 Tax=Chondromyces apiculatus DSM 436 TaxID=1192034 RepID=A0A017T0H5_9BACT|nr:VOC family protein [Chondromyces apiculatus]EYF02754.1 glyoxalase family protein [Chondromyces apiculatus DSM 436]
MDIAPTPSAFVKLLTSDADRSARFYEALGFERIHAEPPFVHLRWGGSADVYLVTPPPGMQLPAPKGVGVLLGFRAGQGGVDAVTAKARALGVTVGDPIVQPWHTREIVVTDPDGYRLNFIEPA